MGLDIYRERIVSISISSSVVSSQRISAGFVLCRVLLWFFTGRLYQYPSQGDLNMIAPVPVKQPWRIWVNKIVYLHDENICKDSDQDIISVLPVRRKYCTFTNVLVMCFFWQLYLGSLQHTENTVILILNFGACGFGIYILSKILRWIWNILSSADTCTTNNSWTTPKGLRSPDESILDMKSTHQRLYIS